MGWEVKIRRKMTTLRIRNTASKTACNSGVLTLLQLPLGIQRSVGKQSKRNLNTEGTLICPLPLYLA